MKNILFCIIICLCISCSVRKKQLTHYLSPGIENINIFPANKQDSATIEGYNTSSKKSLEECEKKKNLVCTNCSGLPMHADFPKGISNFRNVLFNRFKIPANAIKGESRVRITIGAQNNIEKIEILKYTDENTKKAIEDVFKLKELNTWKSAMIYGIPVKEQFETSIFVEEK